MNTDKLKSRDLVTIAIFTVVFFVIIMVGSMTFGLAPFLYPFLVSFIAIIGGTVWAYMRVKVPRRFTILIQSVIISLLLYLIGAGWFLALGCLFGGIVAELITSIGGYKDFKFTVAGFVCFCLGMHFGAYLLPLTSRDEYVDFSVSAGIDAEYLDVFLDFMSWPIVLAAAALCIVCAIVGMFIGKALLKKHFVKAGLV